jgi:hypothetical protein
MIEQKLAVGRYIELVTPSVGFVPAPPPPAGFRTVTQQVLHIETSASLPSPVATTNWPVGYQPTLQQKMQVGVTEAASRLASQFDRQRTSNVAAGPTARVHRNFVWLEWLPGFVSEVATGGIDVLTGPMSGCWIMLYTRGGVQYVGHVGTEDDPNTANSIAAKGAWNAYGAAAAPGSITGFDPARDWVGPTPAAQGGDVIGKPKTYALVTSAFEFYSVVLYAQSNKLTRYRIAGIQQLHSSLAANAQIP